MKEPTTESRLTLSTTLLAVILLTAAGGCAPDATEERIEEQRERIATETEQAGEAEEAAVVEQAVGDFQLTLAGDIEAARRGTASCVVETRSGELRVSLDPTGPSDYRYHLVVPEYDRATAHYEGQIQLSGAERAAGPADVGIAWIENGDVLEPQLAISFEGTYAGAAGVGTIGGEARCALPSGDEPEMSTGAEVEEDG